LFAKKQNKTKQKKSKKRGEWCHHDRYPNLLEDEIYVTWVPDVGSYKLYEWCIFYYRHLCLTRSTKKSVFLQRKSAWITNRRNNSQNSRGPQIQVCCIWLLVIYATGRIKLVTQVRQNRFLLLSLSCKSTLGVRGKHTINLPHNIHWRISQANCQSDHPAAQTNNWNYIVCKFNPRKCYCVLQSHWYKVANFYISQTRIVERSFRSMNKIPDSSR